MPNPRRKTFAFNENESVKIRSNEASWCPAALPRVEFMLYLFVWVVHIFYALYRSRQSTIEHVDLLDPQWFHQKTSFVTGVQKDATNIEWETWLQVAMPSLAAFVGSSLLLVISQSLHLNDSFYVAYSLFAHILLFGFVPVLAVVLLSAWTIFITRVANSRVAAWLVGLVALKCANDLVPQNDYSEMFLALMLYTYKTLQLINFCCALVQNHDKLGERRQSFFSVYLKFATYAFYLPYSVLIVVLYEDFNEQWRKRTNTPRDVGNSLVQVLVRVVRLFVWMCVIECLLSFVFVSAFMSDEHAMARLPVVAMVSVAYFAGVLFHLKYVVIFGLPSLFALIDNMRPPGPPICVSRVTLYSKMWRYFDRGLYQFLLQQVYMPFVAPSFALWRKLTAMVTTFAFVALWHGIESRFVRSAVLSCAEVAVELFARWLYVQPSVRVFFDHRLSPLMQRRLIALLQNICVATGAFAVFYLIGDEGVGKTFAYRLWWTHGVANRFDYVFWHLVFMGYCLNQVNLEIELFVRKDERNMKDP